MSILDKVCSVVFCHHGDELFLIGEMREYLNKCAEASKRNSSKVGHVSVCVCVCVSVSLQSVCLYVCMSVFFLSVCLFVTPPLKLPDIIKPGIVVQ